MDILNFDNFFEEVYYSVKESASAGDMTILDFLDKEISHDLFGIYLNRQQRLILKCFYNLYDQLDQSDLEILEAWWKLDKTTWDINDPQIDGYSFQSLILQCGRRSGKTLLGSIITAFEFYRLVRLPNPQAYYKIAGSTPISIFVIATAATQSKRTVFKQATGVLKCVPHINHLDQQKRIFIGEEEVRYNEKSIFIYSGNSQSSSQVGQSVILLVLDEVARFKDKAGQSNAMQLWSNLGISGVTFGKDARRVALSSAWYIGDAIETLYKASQTEPSMVGFSLCSWDVNPEHAARDNPIVATEYAIDPVQAALEFENKRTDKHSLFFNEEECRRAFRGKTLIYYEHAPSSDSLVRINLTKVIPISLSSNSPARDNSFIIKTILHIDPAVKSDSYGLAFGHAEIRNDIQYVIIDGLLSWEPDPIAGLEVSITNVQEIIYKINNAIPLSLVSADQYGSEETLQRLKSYGIPTKSIYFSNPFQVAAYKATRDLLHEDRLILPSNSPLKPRVLAEMLDIHLKNEGRKIDHGVDGSKDLMDCIAAIVYQFSSSTLSSSDKPQFINTDQSYNPYSPNNQSKSPATDPRLLSFLKSNSIGVPSDFYPATTNDMIKLINANKRNINKLRKEIRDY